MYRCSRLCDSKFIPCDNVYCKRTGPFPHLVWCISLSVSCTATPDGHMVISYKYRALSLPEYEFMDCRIPSMRCQIVVAERKRSGTSSTKCDTLTISKVSFVLSMWNLVNAETPSCHSFMRFPSFASPLNGVDD